MADGNIKLDMQVEERIYYAVFFPVAKYQRVGEVSVLYVFWLPIYQRAGEMKRFLGFTWGKSKAVTKK